MDPASTARDFAPRDGAPRSVPTRLVGDWISGGNQYRFNYDGTYSLVTVAPYTIEGEQTLYLMADTYERIGGTTGIQGTWRCESPEGEYLDVTFGTFGFYAYLWDNVDSGGRYYGNDESMVAIVEVRAYVECSGSNISFTTPDGTVESGTFQIITTKIFPAASAR